MIGSPVLNSIQKRAEMSKPSTSAGASIKELTLRGVAIGGIITLVFTAANVYLGLKAVSPSPPRSPPR